MVVAERGRHAKPAYDGDVLMRCSLQATALLSPMRDGSGQSGQSGRSPQESLSTHNRKGAGARVRPRNRGRSGRTRVDLEGAMIAGQMPSVPLVPVPLAGLGVPHAVGQRGHRDKRDLSRSRHPKALPCYGFSSRPGQAGQIGQMGLVRLPAPATDETPDNAGGSPPKGEPRYPGFEWLGLPLPCRRVEA